MIRRPETATTAPPVAVLAAPVEPPSVPPTIAAAPVQSQAVAPDPDGVYYCEECKSNHRHSSRVGKDHVGCRK
jgi:hypothetical protein